MTQMPARVSEEPEGIRAGSSAKIEQLVDLLRLNPVTEKSLVFSQFTSFLDKVQKSSCAVVAFLTTIRLPKLWNRKGKLIIMICILNSYLVVV